MKRAIKEELMWRGITPPPEGSKKTTCPECSHTRAKKHRRCLSIKLDRGMIFVLCFHCGHEDCFPQPD
jgi:hypothetical protein